jgi:hypothetical protein
VGGGPQTIRSEDIAKNEAAKHYEISTTYREVPGSLGLRSPEVTVKIQSNVQEGSRTPVGNREWRLLKLIHWFTSLRAVRPANDAAGGQFRAQVVF